MSELNFYPDNCVLKRATGTVDAHGDEVFDLLYEGECGLQFPSGGGNVSSRRDIAILSGSHDTRN
jgi:hypothetical protein